MESVFIILGIGGASVLLWRYLSKRLEQAKPPQTHQPHSPSSGRDKGAIARSAANGHSMPHGKNF